MAIFKPPYGVRLNRDHPLAYGLVGCWLMNENSGNKTYDLSGYGKNGIIYGADWVPEGLNFNGSSDYVDTENTTDLANWTVVSIVKSPAAPGSTGILPPIHRECNYQLNWDHPTAGFQGVIAFQNAASAWYSASFGTLSANIEYHLIGSYDGETLKAIKNGVLITANTDASGAPATEAASLKFGRHAANTSYWNGIIYYVMLYDRALSEYESAWLYAFPYAMFEIYFDPLLYITTGWAHKIMGISAGNIAKVNGILKSNISKVIGV